MAIIAPDIGIDLGTSNTLVYVKHKGVVLNEPTLMVVTGGQKKSVKAFGEDARLMLGRTTPTPAFFMMASIMEASAL